MFFTADLGGEFQQLRYIDLQDGSVRTLTAELEWDIDDFEVGPDGRYLAYVANVDGYSRLAILDLGAAETLRPNGLPDGLIFNLRFNREGNTLGMSIESARSPGDRRSGREL